MSDPVALSSSSASLAANSYSTLTGADALATQPLTGSSQTQTLLFVDSRVEDYEQLVAGIAAKTQVVVLDPDEDAIARITQTLQGHSGIASVHIVSHGVDGGLQIGRDWLTGSNLDDYAPQLQQWGTALTENADILLYGCNVAATAQGESFVSALSQLTGADVAASNDLTGNAALGGNWTLEFATGAIETGTPFALSAATAYTYTLATFTVINTNDNGAGSLRQAIASANAAAGDDIITFAGATFTDATPDTITLTSGQLVITSNITIDGTGANSLTISGNNASRVFFIGSGSVVNLNNLTIANGNAGTGFGGGIDNRGTLTLNAVAIRNSSAGTGGGLFSFGTTIINNSTISGNTATTTNGGGGIFNVSNTLTVTNSTISGNTGTVGGGIRVLSSTANLTNVTITNNTATSSGGGILNSGTVNLRNSIIAGNNHATSPDVQGFFNNPSHNLIGRSNGSSGFVNGVNGNIVGTIAAPINSDLGALADNGGPTQTHALLPGSRAANAGNNTSVAATDQRGQARIVGGTVDMGAVESNSLLPSLNLSSSTLSIAEGSSGSFVIARGANTTGDLTVNLTIDGSSTTSATDYTLSGASVSISGSNLTLVIPDGQASVTLSMAALAEAVGFAEPTETLRLNLATSSNYTVGASANATISVLQNGFTVINTTDAGEGSLRQAILNANAIAGTDTITFAGDTFTDATPDTITLTSGQLSITSNITINGTGANLLTLSGNNTSRVFFIDSGTVIFNNLTIANANAGTVVGGSIDNRGTLTLNTVAIRNSRSPAGGGLFNSGTTTINNSTISGNTATENGGGGIYNTGTTTINNSTISGNTATENGGGGIYNSGTANLTNVTITNNTAVSGGGGGIMRDSGSVNLRNSIVAGNISASAPDVQGTFTNPGHNLIDKSDGSTGFANGVNGNIIGTIAAPVNSGLGALANNGGPTQTHALLTGSLAINAGNNALVVGSTDQRGNTRIVDGTVDMGAFEYPPTLTLSTSTPSIAEGSNGSFVISRGANTTGNLTVNLTIDGSSTTSATDYTLSGGSVSISGSNLTLVIPNGQASVTLSMAALVEAVGFAEPTETLRLNLATSSDYTVGASANATISILQNGFTVINTTDAGEGSLRQAILNANAIAGDDTITFTGATFEDDIPDTITLTSVITSNITINGTGANLLTLSGNNTSRVFFIVSGSVVNINNLTIANGDAGTGFGGGIENSGTLTLNAVAIRNSRAASGGGLYSFGTTTINNSTISGNTATGAGGGIYSAGGTILTVRNSTISGNTGSVGGGILHDNSTADLTNVTISNNTATNGGGGIFHFGGTADLANVTITNNTAVSGGGGGIMRDSGSVNLRNSIVAGNNHATSPDVLGTFNNLGHNLIGKSDGSTGFTHGTNGNIVGTIAAPVNPGLGALADNGGPTQTHALLTGSRAANAGNNALAVGITDQRGQARIVGGTVDIGAVESNILPLPTIALPTAGGISYTENAAAVVLDAGATLSNPGGIDFTNSTLAVDIATGALASDRLSIQSIGGVSLDGRRVLVGGTQIGTYTGGFGTEALVVAFNANATAPTVQTLLRAIAYSSVDEQLSTTASNRAIAVTLTANGETSTPVTKSVTVTGVNDAPLIGQRTVLYDGALNTAPGAQGWLAALSPGTVESVGGGATTLNTSANLALQAGYSRVVPTLNPDNGFVLSFRAQVLTEALAPAVGSGADKNGDGKPDRAGFSLIVVSNDNSRAIELGFTKTLGGGLRIWAQEDGTSQANPSAQASSDGDTRLFFTQAEGVDVTDPGLGAYDLAMVGDTYTLYLNGTAILSGKLRDYTAFVGTIDPYETPNLVFFGDNTTSASGSFSLAEVSVLKTTPLPNQTINEDSVTGPIPVGIFDLETPADALTVTASSDNPALVPNDPANVAIAGSGAGRTLTLTPAADAFGAAQISLTVGDGVATAVTTLSLTVNPVNDAPTVTLGGNQTVLSGSGAQSVTNWATGFNPGPANESAQTVDAYEVVSNTNPGLFAADPAIAPDGTLTYTPNNTSGTATIGVRVRDSGGIENGGVDVSTIQTFTITVNPQTVTITAPDAIATELPGNPGLFRIQRETSFGNLSVNLTLAGTASASDYVFSNNVTVSGSTLTVTIPDGQTSVDIGITPILDELVEGDETVALTLAGGQYAVDNAQNTATVEILDAPVVSISATDPTASEVPGNPGMFRLTRTGDLSQALTVNYTINGTATNGTDYNSLTGIATIAAGQSFVDVQVNPVLDELVEGNETVVLTLDDSSTYVVSSTQDNATVMIQDAPVISVIAQDAIASELPGNPGAFRLTRTGDLSQALTVNYTVNGTATNGTDYNSLTGTAVIPAGQSFVDVQVNPVLDELVEGDETVVLTLDDSSTYVVSSTQDDATVTIQDAPVISVIAQDAIASELPGNPGVFRLTRTGDLSQALTVNYTINGTATNGTDYSPLTGTATIAAGQAFVDVQVNPVLDELVEGDETVVLTLAGGQYAVNNAQNTAAVTIIDAPPVPDVERSLVAVSVLDGIINEHIPNSGIFRFNRTGDLSQALTVNYRVAGNATNGVDYDTLSGTAIIPVGQAFVDVVVNPINDTISELDETIRITLAEGDYRINTTAPEGTLTILANDPVISIRPIKATRREGNRGTQRFAFRVSLSHASDQLVAVRYRTLDGTATVADGDYSRVTPTQIKFRPGMTHQRVTVLVRGDTQFERNEKFFVRLSNPQSGSLNPNALRSVGRIRNDDARTAYDFGAPSFRVQEGDQLNTVRIPLIRSGNVSQAGSVKVRLLDGSAIAGRDFLGGVTRVNFAAGQTTAWVPLRVLGNTAYQPDRNLTMALFGFSHVGAYSKQRAATVTLVDDDILFQRGVGFSGFRP
ncbi:MAG: DUF4347 domain-containing protein [Kaiparowitsia implicata GSE-PSE-MK54-09C]|jgi:hypothetical protein|nr:DUF4347 domain-containing protein [Kaiparowitsia implicata GSE-PSE-MK54-09C]